MPDLFPVFDAPQLVEDDTNSQVMYPEGPLYDFSTGDYVIDGAGRVVMADGHTVWAQWCIKAVMTERFESLAYTSDYGAEMKRARQQPNRQASMLEAERAITEALMVDPRTQTVKDFKHDFKGDSHYISFTAVPAIGREQRLEVMF
ncbi:DUF2634 domain-containing protein [Paenibacillus sp. NPDC057967]|uniref:DUF2634 domain-containing protein n=1 Tax=Paenibacillus sp. NPDC057967 TaxID=3346293 RepID=UPI0036DDF71B